MLKTAGVRVIATVGTSEKAALARGAGADDVILYNDLDFAAEVRRLTDGRGVDVVYDGVGATTFDGSIASLRPRGLMVLYGAASGPVPPFDPQTPEPPRLAVPDPPFARPLHRRPRRAGAPCVRRPRRRRGRQAQRPHRRPLPARGGGRSPPGPRRPPNHWQGAVVAVGAQPAAPDSPRRERKLVMPDYVSKAILITGCSTGIGRATAEHLARRGPHRVRDRPPPRDHRRPRGERLQDARPATSPTKRRCSAPSRAVEAERRRGRRARKQRRLRAGRPDRGGAARRRAPPVRDQRLRPRRA